MDNYAVQQRLATLNRMKAKLNMGIGGALKKKSAKKTVRKTRVSGGSKTTRKTKPTLKKRGGVVVGAGKKKKTTKKVAKKATGKKTTNPWIKYVKQYAKAHGITYKEAISKAAPSYRSRK